MTLPQMTSMTIRKTSKFRPYLAALIVNITSLSVGITIGWMSPAAPILQSLSSHLGDNLPMNEDTINWMGSLLLLGSIIGIFLWGFLIQRFGRKTVSYFLAMPMIIGWMVILIAQNSTWILIGRFIIGISGTGAAIVPALYANEISEDSFRGTTGSFTMLMFNFGVLLIYFIGVIVSLRISIIISIAILVFYLIILYFLPESPVYLWTNGKKKEAEDSLMWLRAGDVQIVERELSMYKENLNSNKSTRIPFNKLYENKGTVKAMIISFVLFAGQHFCARPVLLMYTTVILKKSEMDFSYETGTLVVGIIQLASCFLTSYFIDSINRKTLIIFSFTGMWISLFIIGVFFYLKNFESVLLPNWTPMIFICFHIIFYFISSSMPFVISLEILNPEIKSLAFSICIFWGALMSFFSVKLYSVLVNIVNLHGSFWFFAFWCFGTVIFTIFYIPETRGKSLVEILNVLNGENKVKINHKNKIDDYNNCEILIKESN